MYAATHHSSLPLLFVLRKFDWCPLLGEPMNEGYGGHPANVFIGKSGTQESYPPNTAGRSREAAMERFISLFGPLGFSNAAFLRPSVYRVDFFGDPFIATPAHSSAETTGHYRVVFDFLQLFPTGTLVNLSLPK
jgi:hypothetical protein